MPSPDSAWNLFTPQMMDPKNMMAMNQPTDNQGVPQMLQPTAEQLAALKLKQQQQAIQDQADQEQAAKSVAVEKAKQLAGVSPKPVAVKPPPYSAPNATDGLPPEAMASYLKALSDRQTGVQSQRDQLTALGDRPSGFNALDLTPLAGLVDTMTGSNLAKDYKGPQQLQQWDQKKALLQGALDKSSDKISDDQLGYLKMLSDNTNKKSGDDMRVQLAELRGLAMANGRGGSQDNKDDRLGLRVGDIFDKDHLLQGYSQKYGQLQRGIDLITNAPGGVVSNQSLKAFTNDVANSLAQGASSADDREKQEYSNVATKWAEILSKVSSAPQNVNDPELVKFVMAQAHELQSSFKQNDQNRRKELSEGRSFHSELANKTLNAKATKTLGAETVKVRHNGKTLEIPQADLQDALNDGAEKL